jgi:hypothetical protein
VVVERRVVDRFAEDAEVLARDARVLDLREAALVRVRVEEVAGLDVRPAVASRPRSCVSAAMP